MAQLKYSRQRESIKENLMHRSDHPTADMVYTDIRKIYPNISLGTVYRNLALLSSLGEILKLSAISGADRYDGRTSPHNHFMCKVCGAVKDMDDKFINEITEAAEKEFSDGRIDGCSVTFYGVCKECLQGM